MADTQGKAEGSEITVPISVVWNHRGEHAVGPAAELEDLLGQINDHTNVRTVTLHLTLPAIPASEFSAKLPASGGDLALRLIYPGWSGPKDGS